DTGPVMLQARRLELRLRLLPLLSGRLILEHVELDQPAVYLHRDGEGHANWTFQNTKPSARPVGAPLRLPIVRNLVLPDGPVTVRDTLLHLDVEAAVHAHERATPQDPQAFQLVGTGTVNKQPLQVRLVGSALTTLQPAHPYPFAMHIEAGSLRVDSDGVVRK